MPGDLRPARDRDADAISRIYNHYVRDTIVTFETDEVTPDEIAERMAETARLGLPWLAVDVDGALAGYAYASRWKGRCAYRYSVESTIYLDPHFTGRGLGRPLYAALLDAIRDTGMHAVIGGISMPNEASVRLHESLGFRGIGRFEEVGYKFGRWIDVGYWQKVFTDRST